MHARTPTRIASLFLLLLLPLTLAQAPPCTSDPCRCTLQTALPVLKRIPSTLLPPVAWAPVTSIIPTIKALLSRPPPTPDRERSFLRQIESALNAMFASQFAAHAVANNARVDWRRVKPLLAAARARRCGNGTAALPPRPTANVFMEAFPPTISLLDKLVSYDALRTVVRPLSRALDGTNRKFSNFTRNDDVKTAVDAAVALLETLLEDGLDSAKAEETWKKFDDIALDDVFGRLLYGWYAVRKGSERRVLLAIADQVEPIARPSVCGLAPVNRITCGMCT